MRIKVNFKGKVLGSFSSFNSNVELRGCLFAIDNRFYCPHVKYVDSGNMFKIYVTCNKEGNKMCPVNDSGSLKNCYKLKGKKNEK